MASHRVARDLDPPDKVEVALRQARRERRKGHHRRSMLLLRRAAFEARERPGLWTRYALACMQEGRNDEGTKAFAHAVWLHKQTGDPKRAQITIDLAARAEGGRLPKIYRH